MILIVEENLKISPKKHTPDLLCKLSFFQGNRGIVEFDLENPYRLSKTGSDHVVDKISIR